MRSKHDETNMAAIELRFQHCEYLPKREDISVKSIYLKFPEFGKTV